MSEINPLLSQMKHFRKGKSKGQNSYINFIMCESFIAQLLKSLPAMQETQVQFLGGKDPLEKEMAPHSSILACPMDREARWATVHGVERVGHDLVTKPPPLQPYYLV